MKRGMRIRPPRTIARVEKLVLLTGRIAVVGDVKALQDLARIRFQISPSSAKCYSIILRCILKSLAERIFLFFKQLGKGQ